MDRTVEDDPDLRFTVESLARSAQGLAVLLKDDKDGRYILERYIHYLLGEKPRSYADLADYLEWWGLKFVLPDIEWVLQGSHYNYIYELGPGTGWLIHRLGPRGNRRIAIDKRQSLIQRKTGFEFVVQDLEQMPYIGSYPNDLIVANQFLHCVDNRAEILRLNRTTWLVVEVVSAIWRAQLREFGATPLGSAQIEALFRSNGYNLMSHRRSTAVDITLWRPA